ncbi:MAG: hypothetical protein KAR06_11085 [Deltaproteobacteria bacterium]|nr:hypothetical protein [Deltaproteobacteria bacterium]
MGLKILTAFFLFITWSQSQVYMKRAIQEEYWGVGSIFIVAGIMFTYKILDTFWPDYPRR